MIPWKLTRSGTRWVLLSAMVYSFTMTVVFFGYPLLSPGSRLTITPWYSATPTPPKSVSTTEEPDEEVPYVLEEFYKQRRGKPYPGVDSWINYTSKQRGLKPLVNVRPLRPEFGPVINDITSFKYLISPDACHEDQQLFIAVISAPKYFKKRRLIRQTWSGDITIPFTLAFIIGRTSNPATQELIDEESETHGDIIQVDMVDTYHNLTLKAMGLLNWIHKNCPKVPFVLKCDDDVFVNVRNLATILRHLPPEEKSIYGTHNKNWNVQRHSYDKWKISFEDWPWSSFPLNLFGGSTLISGKAIEPLLAAAQTVPFLWMDDVYLSGLVARKAGVHLRVSDKMFVQVWGYGSPDPCFLSEFVSWLTYDSGEMRESHWATEQYYQNGTHCFVKDERGGRATRLALPATIDFSMAVVDELIIPLEK